MQFKAPLILSYFLSIFLFLVGCGGGGSGDGVFLNPPAQDLICALNNYRAENGKIINGVPCDPKRSPVVLITSGVPQSFADYCSGLLITPNIVLTAGHCVPLNPSGVVVRAGGESFNAGKIYVHPRYKIDRSAGKVFYDLALIELDRGANLPTVPLLVSHQVPVGAKLAAYGYGLDEFNRAGVLRAGIIGITRVEPLFIESLYEGELSNTCGGDSGGPLVGFLNVGDNRQAIGVVGVLSSGQNPSCTPPDLSSYTNLQHPEMLGFIVDIAPGAGLI
ncbi:MAG TPA: trypsin-like serine protease [Oligoflexia bacterium]|nr:trypsin-like serine protease [Oligoflexia bacterium]HMP27763.1 trypsin-like serine protease [Oligoflexia bacterium]